MVTIDADTILEPPALSQLLFAFLSRTHCVTVGGSVYVLNENRVEHGRLLETNIPKNFVSAVQSVEYLRSFLYGRAGLNYFGGAMSFPGAFTLFETRVLFEVGGFDTQNFAYDSEIVTKIHHWMRKHKYPHHLFHAPDAFGWTEVPNNLQSFWKQRNLWQRGMLRSALMHIGMFFNPRYGVVGMLSFPAYIFFEIFGPVVEFTSYILFAVCFYFNIISFYEFFWYMLMAWGYITFLSVGVVLLNQITYNRHHRFGDSIRVFWLVFAELLGFRQYRAACCFVSTFHYMLNRLRRRYL